MLCITNIIQTMDNVQHNTGVMNLPLSQSEDQRCDNIVLAGLNVHGKPAVLKCGGTLM
jgi:hypothetical protein